MPQLTYNTRPAPAYVGMLADNAYTRVLSKLAQGPINVGTLVAWGTLSQTGNSPEPGQVTILPDGLADPLPDGSWAGIVMAEPSMMPQLVQAGMTTPAFADKEPVGIIRKGPIWVLTENATVEGHDVYVRTTTGGAGQMKGSFRDGAAAGFSKLPRAHFAKTHAAGISVVELD